VRCALVCLAMAASALGQQTEAIPKFEVASIKPNATLSTNMSINQAPGGQLNCTNVTLRLLITFAYDVRDYQILDAPGWTGTDRYDVLAKPSASEAATEPLHRWEASPALRQRTQALLADRFGLKVHTETKEMPVYALRVAKGGPKLQATQTEIGPQMSWNDRQITCKKVTMKRFAEGLLAARMERYVLDETGLTGEYDFKMTFASEHDPPKDGDPDAPSFLTALQEQLGLRLVPTKGTAPFLVIDHAERPSAN
jgi:uncharacterized protein (TIGR03435 family)